MASKRITLKVRNFPVNKYIWLTLGVSFLCGLLALIVVGWIDIVYGKYVDSKEYGCLLVGFGSGILWGSILILLRIKREQLGEWNLKRLEDKAHFYKRI